MFTKVRILGFLVFKGLICLMSMQGRQTDWYLPISGLRDKKIFKNYFSHFSIKTYVVGTEKNPVSMRPK